MKHIQPYMKLSPQQKNRAAVYAMAFIALGMIDAVIIRFGGLSLAESLVMLALSAVSATFGCIAATLCNQS